MKRHLFLSVFIFILLFSSTQIQPIYAQESPISPWWSFITSVFPWLSNVEQTDRYTTNENPQTTNKDKIFTTYTNPNNDISGRSTDEATKAYRKGVYFYELLTTTNYEDNIIPSSTHCPENISATNIVCFYYHQFTSNQSTQKILYQRENPDTPIDYNQVSDLANKCSSELKNPDDCYINAYINYQDIPHGDFKNEKDAAVGTSTQFDDSLGIVIPEIDQGEDGPTNNQEDQDIEKLAEHINLQEQRSNLNLIPAGDQPSIPCTPDDTEKNRQYLRAYRDNAILPASWQKNPSSSIKITDEPGTVINGNCFTSLNNRLTTDTLSVSQLASGLYQFNDGPKRSDHRIAIDYDLANIDGGKWLETYNGNCQLDSRVFPALNLLISTINSEVTNDRIGFASCYRSVAQQQAIWDKRLAENNGDEAKTMEGTAKPGTSSHHTGRAIDFSDQSGRLDEGSPIYAWLIQNANSYGFYNYQPEPWHWEYNP